MTLKLPCCFSRLALVLFAATPLTAQTPETEDPTDQEVFELSPFSVSTAGDRGYYASNAISGSRIDVRIQDMPLTIEVVTSEFIEDTGSTDLRESLRYSAGILLQTQNDAFGLFDSFGGVNNPEGSSADKSQSSFKIRGFVTTNTLRNGFRRQHATDTVNIDRVEVIRGPSALLYGVGNFGGVVNYLPKQPLPHYEADLGLGYGSDGWRRGSLDVTGPIAWGFGFRLTAAYEEKDDWTDLNNSHHWFVSPVLQWRWNKTKITLDLEVGKAEDNAIGFKSVRAPTLVGVPIFQADRLETYGFLEFEGKDPRTFRWSGPDTYLNTDSWNANVQIEQELIDDLFLLVGFNRSEVEFESRDIFGGISTFEMASSAPARARPLLDTIEAIQIIDGTRSDVRIPVPNAVLQYNWTGAEQKIEWDQLRAELNYSKRLFQGSRWLASKHSLLLGYSWEQQQNDVIGKRTDESPDGNDFYYKNPTESSYIRFDAPTDGSPVLPLNNYDLSGSVAENEGLYAVYSARFFDERLFLVGGMRQDTTSSNDGYYEVIGSRAGRTFFDDSEVTKQTSQFGASFEIVDGLTVYALRSEGVEPNFGGQRDGLGRALDSSVAEARELGIKINLNDGRIAATISAFKIEREGLPFSYWWAPAPIRGAFDRQADIIYRMEDWNLDAQLAAAAANPAFVINPYLNTAVSEWNAAKAAGAVFEAVNTVDNRTYKYLNASTPQGAAYLDRVFAALNQEFALPRDQRNDNDPWPGWLYAGNDFQDSNVNFATQDWSSGAFFQSISDQAEGWEAQIIWSPTDTFQLVFNYSHVEREVTAPGAFVTYPYAEGNWDRWATWYFPNSNWGLGGVYPEVAYPGGEAGLPSEDTADWAGIGWGKGESLDDTPAHVVTWWASYRFDEDFLKGVQLGFGGIWESKREYASAFTSAGQRKQNETGTPIKAYTDPRMSLNAMVKYSWTVGSKGNTDAFVQLNIDNFLDDTDQYGLVYAPGLSWRLQTGINF
jgi:iron complex outermembrane recepter protein